jgi:nitrite reductase/ring-hydroxylating ferredoxin subunit
MANFVQNEFHADAEIWANKKFQDLNLLPVEKHLADVRRWGESFYPKGFVPPLIPVKPSEEVKWEYLDEVSNIVAGEIHSYSISGEGIIAFKDSQEEILVFDAYCPHQGAHLGCGGVLDDDRVRCPFHGFHYNKDGHGLGPNPENRTKFIPGLNMKPIKHKIENGRIEVYV